MTITSRDDLINALGNNSTSLVISKASLTSQLAGSFTALWRSAGIPGQGAIPTTVAICDNTTLGGFTFTNPVAPVKTYLARLFFVSSNTGTDVQIHDRLAHAGGKSGTVTTAQTVNVDASDVALVDRRGDANYSDVQWWLEWYTTTGSTAVNATCAVTYDDETTANIVIAVAASTAASRMLAINSTTAGRFIKSIQSVTLSASTGTAGNFGVTATRALCGVSLGLANAGEVADWAYLGLPRVNDNACLTMVTINGTTSSGALYGSGKLAQG